MLLDHDEELTALKLYSKKLPPSRNHKYRLITPSAPSMHCSDLTWWDLLFVRNSERRRHEWNKSKAPTLLLIFTYLAFEHNRNRKPQGEHNQDSDPRRRADGSRTLSCCRSISSPGPWSHTPTIPRPTLSQSSDQRYGTGFTEAPPFPAESYALADDDRATRDAHAYHAAALAQERELDNQNSHTALLTNSGASELRKRHAPTTVSDNYDESMRSMHPYRNISQSS